MNQELETFRWRLFASKGAAIEQEISIDISLKTINKTQWRKNKQLRSHIIAPCSYCEVFNIGKKYQLKDSIACHYHLLIFQAIQNKDYNIICGAKYFWIDDNIYILNLAPNVIHSYNLMYAPLRASDPYKVRHRILSTKFGQTMFQSWRYIHMIILIDISKQIGLLYIKLLICQN